MKLHRLKLENFRGVTSHEIELPESGVVVVSGRNEVGKTSMIDALDALIALPDSSRNHRILEAQPTGQDVPVRVEAEFSVGAARVIYTKQWLRKAATTLRHVAGPDAGRAYTSREAHDAAGQLWSTADTTLWKALRYLQAGGLDQSALTDSAALRRALESRAGQTAGDDREVATLLERVGEECDQYWTAQRKKNTKYVQVETACRDAETAATQTAQRLQEIGEVEEQLADLVEDITTTKRALDKASADKSDSDRSTEEIGAVQQLLQEAQRLRDSARGELDRARERAQRRQELVAALVSAEKRNADLADELHTGEAELEPVRRHSVEAEERRTAAQRAVQESRAAHRSARGDRAHLDDVDRHRRVSATLQALETVRARLTELRSRPGTDLDEKILEELEQAERAAERAEAELAAGSARVEFTALGGTRSLVRDGATQEVSPEEPWSVPVTDEVAVEIPGEWQVRISPEQGIETRREASRKAAETFAALLERRGVGSVSEARAAWRDDEETARQVRAAEGERDRVLQGEEEGRLRDDRERLAAAITQYTAQREDDTPLPESVDVAQERVDAAEAALDEAEDTRTRADAAAESARHALQAAQTTLHSLQGVVSEQERALTADRAKLETARQEIPDEDLHRAVTDASEALGAVQEELDEHEATLTRMDAQQVLADRDHLVQHIAGLEKMLTERRELRSSLLGRLEGMGRDRVQREHDQAETALAAAQRHRAALDRRAGAALLLERTLLLHRDLAHAQYVQPFRTEVERLGRTVYGPDFEVQVSESLEVVQRRLGGDWLPFPALSTGAKEQMVILIRLATALLVDPEDGVPVLLDDALGHSDPHRLRRLVHALTAAGERTQVIVLTSNPERFANLRDARRIEM